jgi:phosphoserine aminotransferase
MPDHVLNFSAGPAILPPAVVERAREGLRDLDGSGIGVMEHSHRGKAFLAVHERTVARCRELAGIPEDYDVLFLQGGASTQFFQVPANFLTADTTADYLVTGSWSQKAVKEARRYGPVHIACSSEDANFNYVPTERTHSSAPAYVHFTSNNTIFGIQFRSEPDAPGEGFLVCDASSDIFSRSIDVSRYGLIYAGAQKNLGPSGVTLVIVRRDLVDRGSRDLPTMLQYRTHSGNESMYNTPPTFGIYVMGLVFDWIAEQGGLAAMQSRNETKAARLYDFLDRSTMFRPTVADEASRSRMNVTFVTGDEERDAQFVRAATAAGFSGLKGHRSVGGMRASIYNAFPPEGVDELIAFLREFEAKHG